MTDFTGEVHPFADRFPMIDDDALAEMADDIAANGLVHPIVLTADGVLLDGRNRLAACEKAGVAPTFVVHEGDPVAFIISENVHRRHLSAGQRAMALAVSLVEQGRRSNGRWAYGATNVQTSERLVSTDSLARAGVVLDHSPGLSRDVLMGDLSLASAYESVNSERQKRESEARRLRDLRSSAPDLADQVIAETLSFPEAWGAYQERTREAREAADEAARELDAAKRGVHDAIYELADHGRLFLESVDRREWTFRNTTIVDIALDKLQAIRNRMGDDPA